MGDYDDAAADAEGRRRRPWLSGAAVVLALVVGLVAGFLVGGGTSRSDAVSEVRTGPEAAAPTTSSVPPDPDPPQPCLEAGTAATRVLQELETAVAAIGALDPTALRAVLDRLRPVQEELEGAVADCGERLEPTSAPGPTG